jgi:inward rectifier potassium channel
MKWKSKSDRILDELNDLGFGTKVTQQANLRLLNRDGSFNVERHGLPFFRTISPYSALVTMPWWKFHVMIFSAYLGINILFATLYLLIGPGALSGLDAGSDVGKFWQTFFFSIQTFTTVGYGQVAPKGFLANILSAMDAFVGLMTFALATGLLFARFSRPKAQIVFSEKAVIAPYQDKTAFEFRLANELRSQLIEVEVKILFTRFEIANEHRIRRFYQLNLERNKVSFFPLHWTVVHPIDQQSPLWGLTDEDLRNSEAEFLILITAIDETFSQNVHTRSSYRYDEIIWNAKFTSMFQQSSENRVKVNIQKLHEIETV